MKQQEEDSNLDLSLIITHFYFYQYSLFNNVATGILKGRTISVWAGGFGVKAPSSPRFLKSLGELPLTISVTFQNPQSDIHTNFTQWLARGRSWRGLNFSFKPPFSIHYYSCHFAFLQPIAPLWMPSRRDCKCAALSLYLNDYRLRLAHGQLFTTPSSVAAWTAINTSAFCHVVQTCKHTPAFRAIKHLTKLELRSLQASFYTFSQQRLVMNKN